MARFCHVVTIVNPVSQSPQGFGLIFGAARRAIAYAGGPGRDTSDDGACERRLHHGPGFYYADHLTVEGERSERYYLVQRRRLF